MSVNDPLWSYGKSTLINSVDGTPKWSYGKSFLRYAFTAGELFTRTVSDIVGVTDVLSKSVTFTRSIIDDIGVTDILSRSIIFIRSIVDTIGITDVLSRSIAFVRNIIDTISISDVLTVAITKIRKVVDIVGITDVLKATVIIARKVDSFGVCQIIEAKEKLVSAIKEVSLSGISSIVQNMPYKKSKINKVKGSMKPVIRKIKGIKNE